MSIAGINGYNYSNYYTGTKRNTAKANGMNSGLLSNVLEKGLIIISAGNNVIRFVPPLVIEKEHVDEMISILEDCIA